MSRASHGLYLGLLQVGAGADYAGADLVAAWYRRNLAIFANLVRIAAPGDRILVVFGSGHEPLLRQLVEQTPGFQAVSVAETLRDLR